VGLGMGLQPVERSGPFAAVETDASVSAAWPQCLDIFGTRIVIEPSSDQLSSDAGRPPAEGDDRGGPARNLLCSLVTHMQHGEANLTLTAWQVSAPRPDLGRLGQDVHHPVLGLHDHHPVIPLVGVADTGVVARAARGGAASPDLRDRHATGEISRHGLAVARGRLENRLSDLILPPKTNAANERLAQHLWAHRDDLFTFLRQPGLDATNWRAELAIRFGVILRKVWGGSRTWGGARAQSVLMSVWRTCWQQGRSALDFLSQLLRGTQVDLALPP
jgi:hypothetical protein